MACISDGTSIYRLAYLLSIKGKTPSTKGNLVPFSEKPRTELLEQMITGGNNNNSQQTTSNKHNILLPPEQSAGTYSPVVEFNLGRLVFLKSCLFIVFSSVYEIHSMPVCGAF